MADYCGTLNGYNHHRCRCDACRAANARAHDARRAMRRRGNLAPAVHGYSGYVNYSCRCDTCCAANRYRKANNG